MGLAFCPCRSYSICMLEIRISINRETAMQRPIVRSGSTLLLILLAVLRLNAPAPAAEDPEKIKASVARAIDYLKRNAMAMQRAGGGGGGAPMAPGVP